MFSRKRKPAAAKPKTRAGTSLSLIGGELTVSGDIESGGQLHIEGRVDGNVHCAGLGQTESGIIAGDIRADEARIGGLVEGNVTAGTVTIEATGRVMGDVAYDTISIAAGARVEGRLARRVAITTDDQAEPIAISTAQAEEAAPASTLFSGQPTRIAAS